MKKLSMLLGLLSFSSLSWSLQVTDCEDSGFGISTIEVGSEKSFYSGDVAAYALYREEPASNGSAVAINMAVNHPAEGPGYVLCKAVTGLSGLTWNKKKTTYDEDKGVLIEVPAQVWVPENDSYKKITLKIRINYGKLTVALE